MHECVNKVAFFPDFPAETRLLILMHNIHTCFHTRPKDTEDCKQQHAEIDDARHQKDVHIPCVFVCTCV